MTDPLDTWKSKEEDAIIARSEEASSKLSCFKCGDGYTPLYCLNCANDELQAKCERLEAGIKEAGLLMAESIAENTKLNAQAAQMREALQDCSQFPLGEDLHYKVCSCLDTFAGKSTLARLEEARRLLEELPCYKDGVPRKDWMPRRDQWLKGQP